MSEHSKSGKAAESQLGLGYPRALAGDAEEVDRYAPAVGSTRLSATGVTRSLSTDTTASERSFVARMKARYQAEKDLEREQRQLNALEKERAARRATMDSNLSLPSLGGSRTGAGGGGIGGRVPEIASRFQMSGTATYAQEVVGDRRYHDSLPVGASRISGGSSSLSANSAHNGGIDEFGGIVNRSDARHGGGGGTLPVGGAGGRLGMMEPPHSEVCGCHQCSAKHYGSGTTRINASARGGGNAAAKSTNPREFNVRRTTMPIAPRESSMQHQHQQYGKQQQQAYASSPPRASHNDRFAYSYRQPQQQQLGAPQARDSAATTNSKSSWRSYDDDFNSVSNPVEENGNAGGGGGVSRRVVFAHDPQTIR
nr:uncharacterized protein BN887_03405 [Melanopsichium pennsylvanicum 4]